MSAPQASSQNRNYERFSLREAKICEIAYTALECRIAWIIILSSCVCIWWARSVLEICEYVGLASVDWSSRLCYCKKEAQNVPVAVGCKYLKVIIGTDYGRVFMKCHI